MVFSRKNKNFFLLLLFGVIIFCGVFFLDNQKSLAAGVCERRDVSGKLLSSDTSPDENTCKTAFCATGETCTYVENTGTVAPVSNENTVKKKSSENIFEMGIKIVLNQVQSFVIMLFGMAATLFAWVIDPVNVSGTNGMLNKQAVKDVWIMVRDTLNMTFILVLLFAAFCTIFQVSKWNLKSVWLNILINALLVNFSYPIARFFIDISNVAFYYFVNKLFASSGIVTGSGIMAKFGAATSIGSLLAPNGFEAQPIAYQLAIIIVLFIMGMTFLIIAALFVVRLVALTMLVMFSPIGFVGYIFPSTQSYADGWWKKLFSYSFFAPIMIFMMAIALHVSEALGRENMQSFMSNASANTPAQDANFIANAAFFVIPIIILWAGIGIASSWGIEGANKIVDKVKSGGKWLATRPWAASSAIGKYGWKQSGIPGGVKKGFENARKSGKILGFDNKFTQFAFKDQREEREAQIAGGIGDRKKDWDKAIINKKAEEFRKKYKEKADEHDRVDAVGAGGLVDEILKADLHDPAKRGGDAMKVASMLHALKQGDKKDEFELKLKEDIQTTHAVHLAGLANDGERDVFVKKEMAKNWKILNEKGKQAHDVATKGATAGPIINHAHATAAGATDTWT